MTPSTTNDKHAPSAGAELLTVQLSEHVSLTASRATLKRLGLAMLNRWSKRSRRMPRQFRKKQ